MYLILSALSMFEVWLACKSIDLLSVAIFGNVRCLFYSADGVPLIFQDDFSIIAV